MASFSLEKDDCDSLFITHEVKDSSGGETGINDGESDTFLWVDLFDFGSPSVSFVQNRSSYQPDCSDVLDDDFDGK